MEKIYSIELTKDEIYALMAAVGSNSKENVKAEKAAEKLFMAMYLADHPCK